ncbi:GDSL-type esterase/lipase family protein [Sediminibacterium soli]|uniref:GDSL-type esterase/lipase family protein n=1 Tax=Sediminibacterium soli TaxID=2698829 RepID=UPI00137959D8|nr:GDSL-type esterase/lipase family protein [Sediminibacterium soli]NCI46573.1 G-D-S-L family lipolytic protein [Sediminibacterium soli]
MKQNSSVKNPILCIFLFAAISVNAQKIKIACIGNSITYGALVANREKNNYPAQLQNMLGDGYEVLNFGVSGSTLLRKGNHSYWRVDAFKEALTSRPDIVTIMLGTNDSKMVNRPFRGEFEKDYKDLIDSFRSLPSHPRVVLLLPLPSFLEDSTSIYDPVIKQQIIPMIENVAYATGCETIDLYHPFTDKVGLLVDKIHPSSLGATLIARRLYEVVKLNEKSFDIFSKIKEEKKFSSFHGFACADFTFAGRNCKVVKPKKAVAGLSWIWRARFWGHEPQTDIALLERGFHLVYCDVAELFGNKEAVDLWNRFYAYMQDCGLAKKVAMEAMSRGGVYAYSWALANPAKVACVYADAPVLDLKSWPGGKGKSAGSKESWEVFKKDYNLADADADNFSNSPLNNAAKIARLGIPLLHVVGDADEVVPVSENTAPFEERIKAAGGSINVIHKPGVNHHPHSLQNPTPVVDFILRATGYKTNFASVAAPAAEYRSAAGWTEGYDWWRQNADIDSLLAAEKKLDIVFLGNSITQGIAGQRPHVTHKPGLAVFDSVFGNRKWVCAGISGDRTQNVLWRLQHGNYKLAKPKVLVLTIGVNNFIEDDSPEEIVAGILSIAKWAKINMPATKIILTGPLPTGLNKEESRRKKYEKIQQLLAMRKSKEYIYLPLTNTFLQADGSLSTSDFTGDGIHLHTDGYRKWALALQPVIDGLL